MYDQEPLFNMEQEYINMKLKSTFLFHKANLVRQIALRMRVGSCECKSTPM